MISLLGPSQERLVLSGAGRRPVNPQQSIRMAKFLYSLRNVPDEEANAIRTLLKENGIFFFETAPGNWGISAPAIWLKEAAQHDQASVLLDSFHQSWSKAQKEKFQQLEANGETATLLDRIKQRPLQFIIYVGIALFVLYVSLKPFFNFAS